MICGIRVWLVIDFLLFHLSFALSNDFFQFFVIFFQFYIPLYFLCYIAFVHFRQCKSTLSVKLISGKNGSTFLASANGLFYLFIMIYWFFKLFECMQNNLFISAYKKMVCLMWINNDTLTYLLQSSSKTELDIF